jgi:hypothetical protein
MTASNDFDPGLDPPKLFSARLTPHRSLNRTGFLVLMTFLSVVSFATGIAFLLMGAWPVFGFLGLDVLVIYWAFRVNFRRAAATEEITVTPLELRVRRVSHRGHVAEWVLIRSGYSSTRKSTPNSASSGFIWFRAAAASRSAAFWVPTKRPALPGLCWPRYRPPNGASPITRSAETLVGNRVVRTPHPPYIDHHDEPCHE